MSLQSKNSDMQRTAPTPMRTKIIRGLGEIAVRVNNLKAMQSFYEDVIGLEAMRNSQDAVFFKIAEGYGGHTQVLVLFDRSNQPGYTGLEPNKSTIDHIAFEISLEDYEFERKRLEGNGVRVTTAVHSWVHWRSMYLNDPEGNELELVCYDDSIK